MNRAIHTVSKTLIEAIVLVLILLLLFLGNLRAALVVAAILPLSALSTFLMMRQFGLSANLMSLGGLTIVIGLLVDAGCRGGGKYRNATGRCTRVQTPFVFTVAERHLSRGL